MKICTIDPGLKGCTLVYDTIEESYAFYDHMDVDVVEIICDVWFNHKPNITLLEKQYYLTLNKGVTTTLTNFGRQIGALEALQVPFEIVTPQKWQNKIHGIPSSDDKAVHKKYIAKFVSRIFPTAEIYTKRGRLLDGRSDALGMLYYYLERK